MSGVIEFEWDGKWDGVGQDGVGWNTELSKGRGIDLEGARPKTGRN